MARLNIEPTIFQDSRFLDLVIKVGDPEKAIGRLVLFWSKAQQSWANGSKLKQTDFRPEWRVLIDAGFAEEHEDGIYAKGAETQFGWLRKRHEAGKTGGINSVKAKSSKPKQTKAKPSKSNPLTLTLSPTLTPALDSSGEGSPAPARSKPGSGSPVWAAYEYAYLVRYGHKPVRNAKANALCSQLVKRLGDDAAVGVVKFYLTHQKRWYVDKVHDLAFCVADAEALHTQMLAGHQVTTSAAQDADKSQGNAQVFANVAARMEARRKAKEVESAGE